MLRAPRRRASRRMGLSLQRAHETFLPVVTLSATGAVSIQSEGATVKKVSPPRLRFHFVHIGDEAKRISIRLAEDFRKAHVPLTSTSASNRLPNKLSLAERTDSPYILIMGRKEALEGSAILRNRSTQVETTLPLINLIERLKAVA